MLGDMLNLRMYVEVEALKDVCGASRVYFERQAYFRRSTVTQRDERILQLSYENEASRRHVRVKISGSLSGSASLSRILHPRPLCLHPHSLPFTTANYLWNKWSRK